MKIVCLAIVSILFIVGCSARDVVYQDAPVIENNELIAERSFWLMDAVSIEEVSKKADLIVRAKVKSQTERLETVVLPMYGATNANSSTPVEKLDPGQVSQVGEDVAHTPFTDTTFEISKIYKGDASSTIVLTQVGGSMPHPLHADRPVFLSFDENPMFLSDSEHILFLTAIPETEQLYSIVGPPGRYEVRGELIFPTVDFSEFSDRDIQVPKTVTELETRLIAELDSIP